MKKIFKAILAIGIIGAMALGFAACGGNGGSDAIAVISREEGSGTRGAFVELTGVEVDKVDKTVVTAEITITPGDYLTNSFTLTVTDGTGKVVYTNAKAGTDPIVLTAEDLGVEVLNTEDEFYANVTVNDVSGYIAPTDAVSTQITERRGSGPS